MQSQEDERDCYKICQCSVYATTGSLSNMVTDVSGWRGRLAQRLAETGKSRDELGEHIGKTRGAIGHYLTGRNEPSFSDLLKMAEYVDSPPEWLLFGVSSKEAKIQKLAEELEKLPPENLKAILLLAGINSE